MRIESFRLFRPLLLPLVVFALAIAGCDKKPVTVAAPNSGKTAPVKKVKRPTRPSGTGHCIIRGKVVLDGAPPPMQVVGQGTNEKAPSPVHEEYIVASPKGGLANVVVFLKDAPAEELPPMPAATLDQSNCTYIPHVLAVRAGQTIHVHDSDPVMHNVNFKSNANPPQNIYERPGDQKDVVFDEPEAPFQVKCDIHPWMQAWIVVFDHPYYAVTGPDGTFEIDNVPAGNYTIEAWQEALVAQDQPVTASRAKPADVEFHFKAP